MLLSLTRTPAVASQAPSSPRLTSPAPSSQPSSSLPIQRGSALGNLLRGRAPSYELQPRQRSGSHHAPASRRSGVRIPGAPIFCTASFFLLTHTQPLRARSAAGLPQCVPFGPLLFFLACCEFHIIQRVQFCRKPLIHHAYNNFTTVHRIKIIYI